METYFYYSTQRPVGPGTCPKNGAINIENYPQRKYCPEIHAFAWGRICYDRQLTEQETADYELKPAENIQAGGNPYHQIDMFELLSNMAKAAEVKAIKAKRTIPDEIQKLQSLAKNGTQKDIILEFLKMRGENIQPKGEIFFYLGGYYYGQVADDCVILHDVSWKSPIARSVNTDIRIPRNLKQIIWFDNDGSMYVSDSHWDMPRYAAKKATLHMKNWRKVEHKLFHEDEIFVVNTKAQMEEIVRNVMPYAVSILPEANRDAYREKAVLRLLMFPALEQLSKAGYAFADEALCRTDAKICYSKKDIDAFNRLCRNGTKIKDIFKTSKVVYKTLKYERSLDQWNAYRKMDKFGRLQGKHIQEAYDYGFDDKDIEQISRILSRKYEGKNVFTYASLATYLHRLDMFEAIGRSEALLLLNDCLQMWEQLGMKPRIDGDSLKREHDVAARNIRNRRNEKLAKDMEEPCRKMARNNYSERVFFIRAIKDYDDLLDEARQQHNCVASYGPSIASESTNIYVMREVNNPDKSLITVELDKDEQGIRQKLLAYNRDIRNKAQTEFLERWLKKVRERKRVGAESIAEMERLKAAAIA